MRISCFPLLIKCFTEMNMSYLYRDVNTVFIRLKAEIIKSVIVYFHLDSPAIKIKLRFWLFKCVYKRINMQEYMQLVEEKGGSK